MIAMLVQLLPWQGAMVRAAVDNYTGASDNNWDTSGNWSLGAKPDSVDDALFPAVIPGTGGSVNLGAGELANSLSFRNSFTLDGGDLTLTSGNVTVAPTFTATISAPLNGANGLTLAANNGLAGGNAVVGGGTLLLTNTNGYSGGTAINVGTLAFNNYAALGTGDVTVNAGGTFENRNNAGILLNNLILNTGATYNYTGTGQTSIGSAASTGSTLFLAGNSTINNVMPGTAGKIFINGGQLSSNAGVVLTKTGLGVLQLAGANPGFQGSVVINNGFLEFQQVDALGTGTTNVTINNGGELVASGQSIRHNITLNAGGTISANGNGNATYDGAINVAGNANIALRLFQTPTTPNNMQIRGVISGPGNLSVSAPPSSTTQTGSLLLSGNNAGYAGTITVNPYTQVRALMGAGQNALGTGTIALNGGTLGITPTVGTLSDTGGFSGRYYNSSTAVLASGVIGGFDFGLLNPVTTRTDSTIDVANNATGFFPPGGIPGFNNPPVNVAGLWTGAININNPGAYTFQTQSDDGSILYVDGQPVALNDFSQGFTVRSGVINLNSGSHTLIIKYANGGTGAGLLASYNGPDTGGTLATIGASGGVSNNGSTLFGDTSIANNITLTPGKSGIDLSGTTTTSSGTITLATNSTFVLTGQTGSESLNQQGNVSINGIGTIQTGIPQQLNGLQNASAGADMVLSNPIVDAGTNSLLVKDGPRTLKFTGDNFWTGKLLVAGGNVDFSGFNDSFTSLKFINNTTVPQGNTPTVNSGSGTLTLLGDVSFTGNGSGGSTIAGNLNLNGNRTFNSSANNAIISAALSNGTITKTGLGGLTLAADNSSFTGAITVNQGKLSITNGNALGDTGTGTVVNPGGTVEIVNVNSSEPLTLSGRGQPIAASTNSAYGGPQYSGALLGGTGFNSQQSGPVTLVGDETSVGVGPGNLLTISGVISGTGGLSKSLGSSATLTGTGATTAGPGILKLTGANTFTGPTIVRGGDLWLANASGHALASTNVIIGDGTADAALTMVNNDQFADGTIITFNGGAKNAKFQLNGTTQTVAGFNSNGSIALIQNHENGAQGAALLIIKNPADTSFSGEMRDQNGVLAVTKQGAGMFTLSGDGLRTSAVGTYTGATTINQGKFLVSNSTTFSSPITISGGALEFHTDFGRTLTDTKAIADNGNGFTKSGAGNLVINSVVSNVTGTVNITGGVLNLTDATGNVNPMPNAAFNVSAGAQLQFQGVTLVSTVFNNNVTLNGLTPGGALAGPVVAGTPDATLSGTLTLAATSNVSTGWSDKTLRLTGKITGPGGLQFDKLLFTQQPPVFQVTNTANDYAGGTRINAGTVYFTNGALPSTGNLSFGGFQTQSTLGGTFTGPNIVLGTNGLSSFTRSVGTGAGQVSFTDEGGGFSAVGANQSITFGGATPQLVDWGGAGFSSSATLWLNGSVGLATGSTKNAASELAITNDIVLSTPGYRRLYVDGGSGRLSGALSGAGGLLKDGPNTLTLSGTGVSTNTGLTNITGGTLVLSKTAGVNAIGGDIQIGNNQGGTRRILQLNANEQIADNAVVSLIGSNANNGDFRLFGFSETVGGISDRSGGGVIEVVDAAQTAIGTAPIVSTLTVSGNSDSFYNGFFRDFGGTPTVGGKLALTKNGLGTLTISAGQQSGTGSANYSGPTAINGGKLVYANLTAFGSAVTIAPGASLEFAENVNQSGTSGQVIAGGGNLIKSGLGTTILTAANTYTGTTTVAGGTLTIGGAPTGTGGYIVNPGGNLQIGNGAAGAILDAANIANNGTVTFNRNNAYSYLGVISGTGGVTNIAAGPVVLGGANSYAGVTTVNAGTLTVAGSGISAGGLVLNGGTLAVDFTQANANQAGIVAASAPVTFAGGTLSVTGNVGSTQSLGAVTVNGGASTLNVAGNLALTTGAITRNAGGVLNFGLPGGSSSVKVVGNAGVGGILGGWAVTNGANPTFVAIDGAGNLTPLAAYTGDTWDGSNVAVTSSTSQASSSVANSLFFNTAGGNTVTLSGANRITSGGILMTGNVAANNNVITGGTLAGGAAANGGELIVHQLDTQGSLTIDSAIVDTGTATGLTKAGGGALILSGANAYTGNTNVLGGSVTVTNSAFNMTSANVLAGATLQFGDGTGANVNVAPILTNRGNVIVANANDQTISTAINANSNFNYTTGALNNPTTLQQGTFTKTGSGTLTIVAPLMANQMQLRAGTTILDTGANVFVSGFNGVGLANGDTATLTIKGAARMTEAGDFNVSDQASSNGTLNISDISQLTVGSLFVGKSGASTGIVNQTGGSVSNAGGNNDWRIGGNATTGTGDQASQGTYNLSAGTFQVGRNFQIGASGHGIFNQTGGTVSVTGGFNAVGRYAGGVGELNISGGSYTNSSGSRMIIGESGTGTVNLTGGQLLVTGTAAGTGISIGGNTAGAGTGIINLNGGLLQTPQIVDQNTDPAVGPSTFNFNGGVLRVTSGSASGGTFMQGLTNAFVRSGGAIIDTNGVATTIVQPLLAPTDGSDTSGGLTKLNTGTLTLASAATYGGATNINGGTLQLNFAAGTAPATNLIPATSALILNGGGLLVSGKTTATSQTFSGTTLNSPGSINATIGTGGSVTLALGSITRNSGAAVDFTLPASGAITTTTSNSTGTILGGWATVGGLNWAVSASDGSNPGNITALTTYQNDTWASSNDTTVANNNTQGPDPITNSLRFNVGARTVTINGTGTINSGGILVGTGVGAGATAITGGTLTTGGDLVVSNFSTGTLTLTSILAQGGNLVKNGGGLVILNNAETYSGDTIVGAGTLRIAAANRIPDNSNLIVNAGASFDMNNVAETVGSLSGAGSVVNGVAGTPVLTVGGNGNSTTFSGLIVNGTGNVALTKVGGGTLTLNNVAAGSFTGATTISAGAIDIATPQALANNTVISVNSSAGLVFDTNVPVISALGGNSGFSLVTQGSSPLPNVPVQLTVGNNNNGATFTGGLSGSGTLIKIGTGTQVLGGNNNNDGGVVVNGGSLILSGGNSGAPSTAGMLINSGSLVVASPDSFYNSGGRNVVIANGGALVLGSVTANPSSVAFPTITSALDRIDPKSNGVLAITSDGSLQTPITEDLNFTAAGPNGASNLSLGAGLYAIQGLGTAAVRYTGIITPNANTFRLGGGNGRLVLTNPATLGGNNSLNIGGGGSQGGQLFMLANFGFTGPTSINSGTTIVTALPNGGIAGPLGASSSAASNLILNGGTLQFVGNGASTDRAFTLGTGNPAIDSSGSAPLNFTNTGPIAFLGSVNRSLTLQGNNTGANTLAAAIGDSINVVGANGVVGNGVTSLVKNGNGTWVLSGNNTFSGGVTINNGVMVFAGPGSVGSNMSTGPASVNVGAGGAAALGAGFSGQLQSGLNRISPLSTGTVALTTSSGENLNFDGGSTGASLPTASLGAYGNVNYTGTLTPFGNVYRLGGGGGVLNMPNGGLTGPRSLLVAGGGPGASYLNSANQNGAVVLGGVSDFNGGTQLLPGSVLSITNPAALGVGPLKFQGGVYRVSGNTNDITLASDGVSAREIRIGTEASNNNQTANIDVPAGINVSFSKPFGILPGFGANLGVEGFTKYGDGSLVLAGGAAYNGTTTVENGTLSFGSNPNFYGGNVQVGSNIGGVGTLKLVANDVFLSGPKFANASVVDLYNGSKLDLNGFNDTMRLVRGMGSVVNTGPGTPNLTIGTNNEVEVIGGNLAGSFNLTVGGSVTNLFGTGATINSAELWNNNNAQFTGKFIVNAGGLRVRADGTLGSATEPFKADKITLNNGAVLLSAGGNPVVLGANHGITLGASGGTIWQFGTTAMVVNSPITGPGQLTIADDTGVVLLNSDNNTYTGGTQINSNLAARGMLVVGAGGATGSLPAGDVFFNSGAGFARLYLFKTTDMTLANNFTGPGQIMQVGGGTTTLTGNNVTGQTTLVGGGRLRADFTDPNKSPIGSGTPLQVAAGTFEYVAPAGDNVLRLGALTDTTVAAPTTAVYIGGTIGDGAIQSTYGGSGFQELNFASLGGRTAGMTTSFITSGGVNGVTNRISFQNGPAFNSVIGAAYLFNGSDFAAYDQGGFVRAANYGSDLNTAALNTMTGSRYTKLTTLIDNQANVSMFGINFSGPGANLNMAGTLTMTANPGALLKTGGGTSTIGGPGSISNNGQELIVRTDTATDVLRIDVPINGTGLLAKSGPGQLILSATNGYTGNTLLNDGTLVLTGNGQIGTENAANGSEMRIALASGKTATLVIDSPNASFASGATNNGFRVGEMGNGIVNQSDGTLSAANFAVLGESLGSTGTYNISGGTLKVKTNNGAAPAGLPSLVVGRAGIGTMNISGNANVQVMNGAQILLGNGTFNTVGFQTLAPNAGIATGVGTINQTGGMVNVATNNGVYQSNILGAVVLGVDGAGTYNLNGGTLSTPILARGNGTANFNLGGGTLQATASTLNVDLPINVTGTGAGKGTIDTNGNDLTFTSPVSGSGGVKKIGNGTLAMIGNSSYTGGTDINSGNVLASGTGLGTGVVNVNPGATLTVQGSQQGLLAKFYLASKTDINPNVSTGSTAMSPEFASLDNFNAFVAGKAMVAAESTTARGKVSVNYLEAGNGNQNTALPPAIIVAQSGSQPFVAHVSGQFNAPASGDYTFSSRSDDGTVVWIDGQAVLDNNRSQGVTTPRFGSVNLTAGLHDIVVGYYQGTGGSGFTVGVTIPGQGQSFTINNEQNLPNSLLSYGKNLKVKALNVPGGQVKLVAGALQTLTVGDNTSTTNPLTITGGGSVDLANGGLAVDYAASTPSGEAAVLASVRGQIIAGYSPAKNWQGTNGITSTNAIAQPGNKAIGYAVASEVLPFSNGTSDTFLGSTVDKTTVVARYTLAGDANLDGSVNFDDLVKLAQSYNVTVSSTTESWWNHGDFTYDGITNFDDLVKLAQNYNTSLQPITTPIPGAPVGFDNEVARAFASVPEPGTLSIIGLGALALLARRRRQDI